MQQILINLTKITDLSVTSLFYRIVESVTSELVS